MLPVSVVALSCLLSSRLALTAQELADRFLGNALDYFGGSVSPKRIRKLVLACNRANVPLSDVLALLPSDVAQQVNGS